MKNLTIPEMWTFLKYLARKTGKEYLEEVLQEYSNRGPTYQEIIMLFELYGMHEYYKYQSRESELRLVS